jgi:GGDEF domain-containing protein
MNGSIDVTINIEISILNEETTTTEMFLKKANAALCTAKNVGRNQIVVEK